MGALSKWLRYYQPLFRGRFDFFPGGSGPRLEAWHQGLGMTGGRFWVRVAGGHDLRRRDVTGSAACPDSEADGTSGSESSPGALVGRADGRSSSVTTFPWVAHEAGRSYAYSLLVVGAGGVAEAGDAPRVRLTFDGAGALVGPAPNGVCDLSVEPISGGRFRLVWTYDEKDQGAAPVEFQLFNDAGSPGVINFGVVVATAPYRFRQGSFAWESGGFSHDERVEWAVQAVSSAGIAGALSAKAFGVARAALPEAPVGASLDCLEEG